MNPTLKKLAKQRRPVFGRQDAKSGNDEYQKERLKAMRKENHSVAKKKRKYEFEQRREQMRKEKEQREKAIAEGRPLPEEISIPLPERIRQERLERKQRRQADGSFKKFSKVRAEQEQKDQEREIRQQRISEREERKRRDRETLAQYTKKGQPVLGARIKMLLDKLEGEGQEGAHNVRNPSSGVDGSRNDKAKRKNKARPSVQHSHAEDSAERSKKKTLKHTRPAVDTMLADEDVGVSEPSRKKKRKE